MTNLSKNIGASSKKDEKPSLLKADLNFESIRVALNNIGKKTTKNSDGSVIPDNSLDNYVPNYPEVNLLPPSVKEEYAAQDLLKKFVIGGAAVLGVFGIFFGLTFVTASIYESKIDEISATTAAYNSEINDLKAYSGYRTAIDGKRTELSTVVKGQVDVGKINNDFRKAAEAAGYDISSVSISVSGGDAAVSGSCVNPDPFSPATGIGCLTFSLKDDGGNGSMSKLYTIADNPTNKGFINIYVPSALNGEEGASIDGSVSVTELFYMNKYDELAQPLDGVLSSATPAETETAVAPEAGN